MPEPDLRHERIQFPLRALFAFTLLAAVLAALARSLNGLEGSGPMVASLGIGLTVGLATFLIVQHVRLTCLLVSLLLGFVSVNGFWFSSHMIAYGCGVFAGGIIGWKLEGASRAQCPIWLARVQDLQDGQSETRPTKSWGS